MTTGTRTTVRFAVWCLAAMLVASSKSWAAARSEMYHQVDMTRVMNDIRALQDCGTRVTGYPGADRAADMIAARFRQLGLQGVDTQQFQLPMPVEKNCTLQVGGHTFRVYALWPNLVRTPQTPPDGITGKLIYAKSGDLHDFDGLDVRGAIVVLDFNSGLQWLNAPLLDAAAVLFLEPDDTSRSEAEKKFLREPLNVPRALVTREDRDLLLQYANRKTFSATLKCTMPWQRCTASNVFGMLHGTDPALSKQCIILMAYYDSISVAPGRSPGADQACGISALLEMARLLTAHPPKRSVIFLATPGHFEALSGARAFLDLFGREKADERKNQLFNQQYVITEIQQKRDKEAAKGKRANKAELAFCDSEIARLRHDREITARFTDFELPLVIGLDLSSQSSNFGVFHVGYYFKDVQLTRFFSPIGKQCVSYVKEIGGELKTDFTKSFVDGINPTQDRDWATFFPGKIAFDAEMATRTGRPGITFATTDDSRNLVQTSIDTVDRLNVGNLERQVRLLACLLDNITNDPAMMADMLKRIKGLRYEMDEVNGRVLEFIRGESFMPNTPVPNSVVIVQGQFKSAMGVHSDLFGMAEPNGDFTMKGEQDFPASILEAYQFDPKTGDITYAPDLGNEGDVKYPRQVWGRVGLRRPIIVFRCHPISLYDLVDERYFETLQQIFVYDGRTDSDPLSFGYVAPMSSGGGGDSDSYVEPVAVVFGMQHSRVKITMGMGLLGLRLVLIDSTPGHPQGQGFAVDTTRSVPFTPFRAASDLWSLDASRIQELVGHGILNERMMDLHKRAHTEIESARKLLQQRDYSTGMAMARSAWALESRAYPDVQSTALDVVKGVLFYLAMLLPFAYFGERLLFAFPDINRQIAGTVGVFLAVFTVLRYVHPAFELRVAPVIILLAFIILTLAVLVIVIVTNKFNEQLEKLKQQMTGVHKADVGRLSAVTAAFSLGIGNMRRRKARSALTCVTLILLTFTVLSFTSVKSFLRQNQIGMRRTPVYQGIMIRDKVWSSLEEPTYRIIANEFRHQAVVTGRSWISSEQYDKRAFIDVVNAKDPTKVYTVNGMVGLDAEEAQVTGADKTLLRSGPYGSPAARWFTHEDQFVCILPQSIAQQLGIMGTDVGKAAVDIYGQQFTVIGIVDDKSFEALHDLDGEALTPVDYAQLKPEVLEQLKQMRAKRFQLGKSSAESLLQEYTHFQASNVLLLPFRQSLNMGGTLRSITIRFSKASQVQAAIKNLIERFALSMYAGIGNKTILYSSIGLSSFSGLESVFIPILIAALIVLNTMLGSVYERTNEIGTYSAIGLAPVHISTLFLAESCVYANIGAVMGYLLGQVLSKVLTHLSMFSGLELNYSSMSAVGVTIVVVATVILSTMYPARKAAQMAVPDVERKWKLPDPKGDEMAIPLPFMLTGGDSRACSAFLVEFFEAYVDYTGGEFYTDGVHFESVDTAYGKGFTINLRMWLAPYDLGVSQMLHLETFPTDEGDVYEVTIRLDRETGDINSWKKTNWLFLNIIRKQFLIWRTISPEAKRGYERRGDRILQGLPAVEERRVVFDEDGNPVPATG